MSCLPWPVGVGEESAVLKLGGLGVSIVLSRRSLWAEGSKKREEEAEKVPSFLC